MFGAFDIERLILLILIIKAFAPLGRQPTPFLLPAFPLSVRCQGKMNKEKSNPIKNIAESEKKHLTPPLNCSIIMIEFLYILKGVD